jgi:DNA invertase Pin-like site-specific DNA recombinase
MPRQYKRTGWVNKWAARTRASAYFLKPGRRKVMLVGYTRCSTKDQVDGSTIQEQERKIKGIAMIRGVDGFDIVFYSDPAVSGSITLKKRPQGSEMFAALRKGDILVAAKLDRLFRSASDALYVVEQLAERGVGVILADIGTDPVTDNGVGKLFFSMLAAFAEFERTRINERTQAGRVAKQAQQGCVGNVPYGWRKVGIGRQSRIEQNLEEQAVIANIIRLRQKEYGLQSVADWLTNYGAFNRLGKPFHKSQIADIENRYYAKQEKAA